MLSFLLAGSLWLWIFTIAFIVFEFAFIYNELGWGSTITLFIYTALLIWLFDAPILTYIWTNPLPTIIYTLLYFATGVVWSFFKWYMRVSDYVREYNKEKAIYDNREEKDSGDKFYAPSRKPEASEHKTTFAQWIAYWPFSALWFLLEDAFKRFIDYLVTRFSGIYNKIEKAAYSKLDKEIQYEKKRT